MKLCLVAAVFFAAILHKGWCCTTDSDILIDIVFVVDGSGSIGTKNFELVKLWLMNATATMFTKFGHRVQFAVLEYSNKDPAYKRIPIDKSTKFEIPFRLGDCDTVRCMTSRIIHMEYLQSQTYTYYALRRAIEVEFPHSNHWPHAKKAIVLLTDGAANDGALLPRAYEACVQQGITNFAIGVGNYQLKELKEFANGGVTNERVFTRTDFGSLTSVIDTMELELEKSGFFCDECQAGTDDCSLHADCVNLPDGFDCFCIEGYYGNGTDCKEIDYCSPNPCRTIENTRCVTELRSPRCVCLDGYMKIGEVCEEIDECASNPCDGEHSKCINLVDSYYCSCKSGYFWDGSSCNMPAENPSNFVTILTLVAAFVMLIIIITVVVCLVYRQHTYTIGGGGDQGSRDEYLMGEQKRGASPEEQKRGASPTARYGNMLM